VFKPEIYLRL